MKRINMLSGGLASWATGKLVAKAHGTDDLVHLFADTCWEDEDTYRFLPQAVANIGGSYVRIADGRTPWQVFADENYIGNSGVDPCSKILKRQMLDRWLKENCDPADTTVYVGFMWFERHRFFGRADKLGLRDRMAAKGWRYESPLIDPPHWSKAEILAWMEREGLDPPRLYDEGATHNNCGMRCVKQGQAGWAHLLKIRPESFAEVERLENAQRLALGKDVSMMRDRRGGKSIPLTLTTFRERIEAGEGCDRNDHGKGCECLFPEDDTDEHSVR